MKNSLSFFAITAVLALIAVSPATAFTTRSQVRLAPVRTLVTDGYPTGNTPSGLTDGDPTNKPPSGLTDGDPTNKPPSGLTDGYPTGKPVVD